MQQVGIAFGRMTEKSPKNIQHTYLLNYCKSGDLIASGVVIEKTRPVDSDGIPFNADVVCQSGSELCTLFLTPTHFYGKEGNTTTQVI